MNLKSSRSPEVLQPLIEAIWKKVNEAPVQPLNAEDRQAIEETVGLLNQGALRVAHSESGQWNVNIWAKHAILLFFRARGVEPMPLEMFSWIDKVPIKTWTVDMGVRVVPPAVVRFGAFVASGCVLMPSYVNVGAYVDHGTMVDTWATVGSCAQIGKNVHLSGGVGIGGVLEPAQALPVIIEDECFVGSRVIVVEGVHVKRGAVLGAGVVLTASTSIVDVRGSKPIVSKGVIPENAVVIPGTRPKLFPAGEYHVPCALIIGERNSHTDTKTSLNQVLREFDVPV
jgi:2,3,4,5-tetrahydropyridine-2-carboxylate N-succinyltransferase